MNEYTLEDLREDAAAVRAHLNAALRDAEGQPLEPHIRELLHAHRRVSNYVAGTAPHNRLPSRSKNGGAG